MDGHLLLAYNYHLSSGSANTSSKYNLIHIITKSLYLKYIITIYKTYYMITKILQNLIRAIAIIYLSSCLRPRQWATGEGWHRGWRKTAVYNMGPGQLSLGTFLAIWPNNSRMSWDIYVTTTTEFANVYGMKDGEGVWDAGAGAKEDADATTVMARAKMSGETSFRLHLVRFSVRCCYTSWALAPNYTTKVHFIFYHYFSFL